MAETPAKQRMARMRRKRKGRALSVWLHPPTDTIFDKIKTLTGESNDATIAAALEAAYETLYWKQVRAFSVTIEGIHRANGSRDELQSAYRALIAILALDYPTPADIKTVLNQRGIPGYTGGVGNWRIDQVRRLMP